ncbi:MAG: electron transport complex subunit RsxB [Gammaproteobacteria bacterium]|jgi:electron transport complex protein RnfB|nr:electron transport complex subunit RsxB [Gammaproteobacteria bacterium]
MTEILYATAAIGLLAVVFGVILGYASVRFRVEGDPVVDRINAILPQTQCGQCGYAGCRPYADAMASGEAEINHCPPGGEQVIGELADLLDREALPLDEENGVHKEVMVAVIDEHTCIGCTLCIQACPVDAILGAAKQMHTVLASECTGCELCIPPCPVDCIEMIPVERDIFSWKWSNPEEFRQSATAARVLSP